MITRLLLVATGGEGANATIELVRTGAEDDFVVDRVDSVAAAVETLGERRFDTILLDLGVSSHSGPAEMEAIVAAAGDIPVIVLTEISDEDAGARAVQAGAQDYLVKGRINGDALRRVIRYSRERVQAQSDPDGLERQIAERRRAEQALRESQHRVKAITESMFEGVLVIEEAGHIVFSNPSADSLLGDGDHLSGRAIDQVFTLADGEAMLGFARGPFRRVAETGRTLRDDDAVFRRRDGRLLAVAYACSPLVEMGRRRGAIISFRDIGRLKKAQQDALQASKLASVGQLASGMAHEINTPTQYIGDNLRFLNDAFGAVVETMALYRNFIDRECGGVDAGARARLDQAVKDADIDYVLAEIPRAVAQSLDGVGQVARIVLAMKEFSHPGEREKVAVDLNRAIGNTLAVSRNEWKHLAEITTELDPHLPPVFCLPGEINQVLLNLVVNAAHAIQEARLADKGHIRVATRRRGATVEVVVSDDGVGMTDEVKHRIFDPFFTTKGVGRGTGQGLSICRDVVVAKHGGRISVETREGKGATFTVTLPLDGNPVSPEEPA